MCMKWRQIICWKIYRFLVSQNLHWKSPKNLSINSVDDQMTICTALTDGGQSQNYHFLCQNV